MKKTFWGNCSGMTGIIALQQATGATVIVERVLEHQNACVETKFSQVAAR